MSLRNALLIAAIGLTWTLPASAAGCQYDMQCKGDRICNQGQCMAPPDSEDAADNASQVKPLPPIKLSPQPQTQPQPQPQLQQQPQQQPHAQQASLPPRSCCTVAGKLRLVPPQSGDAPLTLGEMCQGITNSGKPVPGTACN